MINKFLWGWPYKVIGFLDKLGVMEVLNTRELAYLIWLAIGLLGAWFSTGLRKDLFPIGNTLVSRSFLKLYGFFLGYNFLMVALLKRFGVWELSMLKDTLIWMLFAGLPLVYKAGRAKDIKVYFLRLLKSLLTFAVVLEFLMGLHTFSLLVELILVPMIVFPVLLVEFAKARQGAEKVVAVVQWTSLLVTMSIVLGEFSYVVHHASEFVKLTYFWQFWLPAELAVLLIPFLYAVVTYLRFEETFAVISLPRFSTAVSRYCKMVLPFYFYNDLSGLVRWRMSALRSRPASAREVRESIKLIKEVMQAERNPPRVHPSEGWSPYTAKNFMIAMELVGREYICHYGEQWGAVSNTKHLNELDWMANSVDYYVNGNRHVATQLELRLEVFDSSKVSDAHSVFLAYVAYLWAVVGLEELPAKIAEAILSGEEVTLSFAGLMLFVEKSFCENVYGGYDLKFTIEHAKHVSLDE